MGYGDMSDDSLAIMLQVKLMFLGTALVCFLIGYVIEEYSLCK